MKNRGVLISISPHITERERGRERKIDQHLQSLAKIILPIPNFNCVLTETHFNSGQDYRKIDQHLQSQVSSIKQFTK